MLRLSYLLFLTIFCNSVFAQNLVPNPSFEDTVSCPVSGNQVDRAIGWHPSRNTPDYFHECDWINGTVSVPYNVAGYQYAHSGLAYCGFIPYARNDTAYRENFTCQLLSPLIIGNKYSISFYISHADFNYRLSCNKLGVLLSTVDYTLSSNSPTSNFCHFFTDSIITDTLNWTLVSGSIIADSNYSYLTIGNFFESYLVDTIYNLPSYSNIYYYIDDISLTLDTLTSLNALSVAETVKIFPNPTREKITIISKNKIINKLQLFNANEKLLKQFDSFYNNLELDLNLSELVRGIYFLRIFYEDKSSTNHKLFKL